MEEPYRRVATRVVACITCLFTVGACAEEPPDTRDTAIASQESLEQVGPPVTVTLLTGDRVHLARGPDGRTTAHVEPGPGRDGTVFLQQHRRSAAGEEIHVIPGDALPLLAAGQLDPDLFNATALSRRPDADQVRVIVRYRRHRDARVAAALLAGRPLDSIGGAAIAERDAGVGALWATMTGAGGARAMGSAIEKVWLDRVLTLTLDRSAAQVGAPEAWAAGFDGSGATVAVLDTGIDPWHPDLESRIRDVQDFTGTDPWGLDDIGHGTHVAGIIAGTGFASDGRFRGVAPGASLLIGRVCVLGDCLESDILAGMEWAAPNARVVNLSLGGEPTDGTDPLDLAVNALSAAHGTLFVISAGNRGRDETVSSPGSADAALTVGSVTKDDALSDFSSRGPRIGDGALKPDLVAPGTGIVAARGFGIFGDDPVDDWYMRLSGTSMAAPHVTGAAAIVAAAHPGWDGARIKAALMGAARPIEAPVHAQGAGRLDVSSVVSRSAYATPPSISFGAVPWPHDAAPMVRTVSIQNDADHDVSFDAALDVQGPNGSPVPAGMFTVEPATLVIPAGGAATIAVTVRPQPRSVGVYGGWLRVTGGGQNISIPVAVQQATVYYDLTLEPIGVDGRPSADAMVVVNGRDVEAWQTVTAFDPEGRAVVRLPRGRYSIAAFVDSAVEPRRHLAMVIDSDIELVEDTHVVLDARTAVPAAAIVERSDAVRSSTWAITGFREPTYDFTFYLSASGDYDVAVTPARPAAGQGLEFVSSFCYAGIDTASGLPYRYVVAFPSLTGIPDDLTRRVADRDLARVEVLYRGENAPATGMVSHTSDIAGSIVGASAECRDVAMPSRGITYFTPGTWSTALWMRDTDDSRRAILNGTRRYVRGRQAEEWNRPPFGPAFRGDPGAPGAPSSVGHHPRSLYLIIPLFSPSEPGHVTFAGSLDTMTVRRAGEVVEPLPGWNHLYPVPPERADYTVHVTATDRAPWSTSGRRLDATWTFTSEAPANDEQTPLPMLAVRAYGHVGIDGSAPAGVPYLLALTPERPAGAPPSPITALALEVSYDDGASWRPAPLLRIGDRGLTILRHPDVPGFVSLRISAADAAGSTVRQAVVRAYRTTRWP